MLLAQGEGEGIKTALDRMHKKIRHQESLIHKIRCQLIYWRTKAKTVSAKMSRASSTTSFSYTMQRKKKRSAGKVSLSPQLAIPLPNQRTKREHPLEVFVLGWHRSNQIKRTVFRFWAVRLLGGNKYVLSLTVLDYLRGASGGTSRSIILLGPVECCGQVSQSNRRDRSKSTQPSAVQCIPF